MTLLIATLPIFLIILIGYLLARFKLVKNDASDLLARLIFYFIMPITLFIDLARLPIHQVLSWPYLFSYFITSITLICITCIISCYVFQKKEIPDLVINAMATTQTNTAYLALPIFLLLFKTVVPVAGVIVVQAIFNF